MSAGRPLRGDRGARGVLLTRPFRGGGPCPSGAPGQTSEGRGAAPDRMRGIPLGDPPREPDRQLALRQQRDDELVLPQPPALRPRWCSLVGIPERHESRLLSAWFSAFNLATSAAAANAAPSWSASNGPAASRLRRL